MGFISLKKVSQLFQCPDLKNQVEELEKNNIIPTRTKYKSGAVFQKGWKREELPLIGEKIGFFSKPDSCKVATVFTTKGGVLKSTLALNIARTAALHNLKTLVIGLDIQGDITNSLGREIEDDSLEAAIENSQKPQGLPAYFNSQRDLSEIIQMTDLDNLMIIPETPELAALNESLGQINRREYWLRDKIVERLKPLFDLIIFDCSPNWNKLTTNALVSSDILISPLECKINNFRNFKVFKKFIDEFKQDMRINFDTVYVPTKYAKNKKLSQDIKSWYQNNLPNCLETGIVESVIGEEAVALKISMLEHRPANKVAKDMCTVLKGVNQKICDSNNYVQESSMLSL
jgi:chromosome partitioning protein